MTGPLSWGSDTDVSMPEPIDPNTVTASLDLGGGYVFTNFGLRHNFTKSDAEVFYLPTYAPLPSDRSASR